MKHINNNDWKFDDPAYTALDNAIITPPEARPTEALSKIYNIAKGLSKSNNARLNFFPYFSIGHE